jgi:hypothetical protein
MSHPVLRHRHHLLLLAAVFTMLVCIFSTGGSWAAVNDTNEPDLGDEVTPLPSKERMEENEKKCMSLYNHDKLMRAPPKPIDCRVVGESIGWLCFFLPFLFPIPYYVLIISFESEL